VKRLKEAPWKSKNKLDCYVKPNQVQGEYTQVENEYQSWSTIIEKGGGRRATVKSISTLKQHA